MKPLWAAGTFVLAWVFVPAQAQSPGPPWATPGPKAAQAAERAATPAELRELRDEIARLREEIAALRKEMREAQATAAPHPREAGAGEGAQQAGPLPETRPGQEQQETPLAAKVQMLEAQVAEQAQTKVESETRFPVRIFGAVISSTFFNSGRADWIDLPTVVQFPGIHGPGTNGSFGSTLRQTRVGAAVDGPSIGGMRSSGVVVMDFFGTIPTFANGPVLGTPRLLYAYARVEGERTAFLIGQDQMIFAPRNPTSLASMSFPGLYRSGNLYLRYPQLRVERLVSSRTGTLLLAGGILGPLGGQSSTGDGDFVHSVQAGERSKHPNLQGRLGWKSGDDRRAVHVGLSGHFGSLKHNLVHPQVFVVDRSWGVALDFDVRAGRFGLGGEGFAGKNLGPFGGESGVFNHHSRGGFIEGRFRATDHLDFNLGFGTDGMYGSILDLKSNSSVFGNLIYRLTPEFSTSLEYRWLQSNRISQGTASNHRLDLVFVYRF